MYFVSTAYGNGCALLKLTPEGGGEKMTEVYFNREMMNHYSSSVLVDDVLYGFSNAILTAMKFQTGEVIWKDRSVGRVRSRMRMGSSTCSVRMASWVWPRPRRRL